jgi:hypothetical protein
MADWAALVVLALGVGFIMGIGYYMYAMRDETDLEQEPWRSLRCRDCSEAYRVRVNCNWSDPVHCKLFEQLNGKRCPDLHEIYHNGAKPDWCPKVKA